LNLQSSRHTTPPKEQNRRKEKTTGPLQTRLSFNSSNRYYDICSPVKTSISQFPRYAKWKQKRHNILRELYGRLKDIFGISVNILFSELIRITNKHNQENENNDIEISSKILRKKEMLLKYLY
jgi:hypothetical protein